MEEKRTILFDLDGTLLPIDMDKFIEKYFRLLSGHFSDLYNPEYFVDVINKATENMIRNDGQQTNKEAFEQKFFELIDLDGIKVEMTDERNLKNILSWIS